MDTPSEFPLDKDGKPLAWPDPRQPNWYIDAWNGIYDSREFALAESVDWVALESERRLQHGDTPLVGDGDVEPDDSLYTIVRFYRDDRASETIERGLTLDEAQAHCNRDDTHGDGWFDGYRADDER